MMFHEIDVQTWPRAEVFHYFSKMAPTAYSLTAEVDVTHLLKLTRERNIRFFPAYLWLVTKNLSRQQAFTFAVKDGMPGYYDSLTPLYATWHEETKTFSFLWTEYSDDFGTFFRAYLECQHQYGQNHGVLARPGMPPENAYTVSALPWVTFSHFAVHRVKALLFSQCGGGKISSGGRTCDDAIVTHLPPCHNGRLAYIGVSEGTAAGHWRLRKIPGGKI